MGPLHAPCFPDLRRAAVGGGPWHHHEVTPTPRGSYITPLLPRPATPHNDLMGHRTGHRVASTRQGSTTLLRRGPAVAPNQRSGTDPPGEGATVLARHERSPSGNTDHRLCPIDHVPRTRINHRSSPCPKRANPHAISSSPPPLSPPRPAPRVAVPPGLRAPVVLPRRSRRSGGAWRFGAGWGAPSCLLNWTFMSAPGKIRTCAHGLGNRCSIP
jgi:hypothetical protein